MYVLHLALYIDVAMQVFGINWFIALGYSWHCFT
jgi:predicted phosphohydrolase